MAGKNQRGVRADIRGAVVPTVFAALRIPAFAGMTGLEIGDDGAAIVHFCLMSRRPSMEQNETSQLTTRRQWQINTDRRALSVARRAMISVPTPPPTG